MTPTFSLLQALNSLFQQTGAVTSQFPSWQSDGQTVFSYYQDLAPEGAQLPFLVYNVIPSPAQQVYGRIAFTEQTIRFTAYATDSVAAMTGMNAWCAALDDVLLPLPNGNVQLFTRRMGDPTPRLDSRSTGAAPGETAKEVWAATVVYQFSAQ